MHVTVHVCVGRCFIETMGKREEGERGGRHVRVRMYIVSCIDAVVAGDLLRCRRVPPFLTPWQAVTPAKDIPGR